MKIQKLLLAVSAVVFLALNGLGQEAKTETKTKPGFDAALAKKVGADKYGMRHYVIAFLRTGPTKIEDKEQVKKLFEGHMANINRLAAEGKLAIAGPFSKDPDFRGLFIFAVETIEDAKKLTETDPAIKSGMLAADYHLWWGSAALMEVNSIHNKIQEVDM